MGVHHKESDPCTSTDSNNFGNVGARRVNNSNHTDDDEILSLVTENIFDDFGRTNLFDVDVRAGDNAARK